MVATYRHNFTYPNYETWQKYSQILINLLTESTPFYPTQSDLIG